MRIINDHKSQLVWKLIYSYRVFTAAENEPSMRYHIHFNKYEKQSQGHMIQKVSLIPRSQQMQVEHRHSNAGVAYI